MPSTLRAPMSPMIDAKSGKVTPEWLRWLQDLADGKTSAAPDVPVAVPPSTTTIIVAAPSTPPDGSGGGGGTTSGLNAPVFLGGSRMASMTPDAGVLTPVLDYVNYVAASSFQGLLRVDLWTRNPGVAVTAVLMDVTPAVMGGQVCSTTPVTSTTPVSVTATGAIVVAHWYQLRLSSNTTGQGIYGIGTLEAAP